MFFISRLGVAQQFPNNLTIFLLLPVSALNITVHHLIVSKAAVEKFSFSELKIVKLEFFTQSSTKMFECHERRNMVVNSYHEKLYQKSLNSSQMDAPACSTTSDAKLLQICCNFQKGFQQLILSILSEDVHSHLCACQH